MKSGWVCLFDSEHFSIDAGEKYKRVVGYPQPLALRSLSGSSTCLEAAQIPHVSGLPYYIPEAL